MSSSTPRVLFLAAGVDSPSVRFRLRQYLPYLQRQGIEAEIGELAVPAPARRRLLARSEAFDAVLVHRALLPPLDHWLLRRSAPRYGFDFDDAIMFRDSAHRNMRSWRRMLRFRRMVRGAQTVIAGNDYLKTWAQPINPNTIRLPTSIELADYPAPKSPPQSKTGVTEPILGWIGTRVNLMYLESLRGALATVGQGTYRPRLKVICDAFPDLPGIALEKKIWTLADEPEDVRSCQIGIMPLPDDVWTRGKCGLKLLQYMAASVPVVCSPVGVNRVIVQDGVNGFTAADEAEWTDRLERLLGDASLRARLGQAGRATVETDYAVSVNAPKFLAALFR